MTPTPPNEDAVQLALQLILERMRQVVREELSLRATAPDPVQLLSLDDAAALAGVSKSTLGRWASRGLLKISGVRRTRRVVRRELEQLLLTVSSDGSARTTEERARDIIQRHVVDGQRL
jgi:DNA-binding MurR/RpiR family transcriptional regulator